MNILVAAFEASPLAKTGGLADVIEALSIEWAKLDHNTLLVLPKHKHIDVLKYGFEKLEHTLYVKMGFETEFGAIWLGKLPGSEARVALIEHEEYFSRNGIYGDPEEYFDNDRRFIFYCRAVFEAAIALDFKVDVLHAHDYHATFTLAFLKSFYNDHKLFMDAVSIYTIHNLAYQGKFNPYRIMDFSSFGMKEFYPGSWFEMHGVVNCMKVGIMFADKITTVSPNYAKEIRMPYYSEGLQDVLNHRGADLIGILNGVFYDQWNPEIDQRIFKEYKPGDFEKKKENKFELLRSFGVIDEDDIDRPLVGMVTRLTEQKGIDIIKEILDKMIDENRFRFIILGSGRQDYVDYFQYIKWKYPQRAFIHIGYDETLAHRIIACSDYVLVPSRFEPCGLTQMYALKYGTVPIVRSTGGLADTVDEYIPEARMGTGFVFNNYDKDDFSYSLDRALSIYNAEVHWDSIRNNGMMQDFSAKRMAKEYIKVFEWAKKK